MTRDDIPTPGADDADAPTEPALVAARAAWRALREPLEPTPELDARIRAAALRAAGRKVPAAAGAGAAATRASTWKAAQPPAPDRNAAPAVGSHGFGARARRASAGWGLALAAVLVVGVVLLLPPAPFGTVPLPAEAPASSSVPASVPASGPASTPGPTLQGAPVDEPMAPGQHAAPAAAAKGASASPMALPRRESPAPDLRPGDLRPGKGTAGDVSMDEVATSELSGRIVAAPPGMANDVALDAAAATAATPAPPPSPLSSQAARAQRAPVAASAPAGDQRRERELDGPPAVGKVERDMRSTAAGIERELEALRELLRVADPSLPARLREFVERHPGHPLARTDPALAAVLARGRAAP